MIVPEADQVNISTCPGVTIKTYLDMFWTFLINAITWLNLVAKRLSEVTVPPLGPSPYCFMSSLYFATSQIPILAGKGTSCTTVSRLITYGAEPQLCRCPMSLSNKIVFCESRNLDSLIFTVSPVPVFQLNWWQLPSSKISSAPVMHLNKPIYWAFLKQDTPVLETFWKQSGDDVPLICPSFVQNTVFLLGPAELD